MMSLNDLVLDNAEISYGRNIKNVIFYLHIHMRIESIYNKVIVL